MFKTFCAFCFLMVMTSVASAYEPECFYYHMYYCPSPNPANDQPCSSYNCDATVTGGNYPGDPVITVYHCNETMGSKDHPGMYRQAKSWVSGQSRDGIAPYTGGTHYGTCTKVQGCNTGQTCSGTTCGATSGWQDYQPAVHWWINLSPSCT